MLIRKLVTGSAGGGVAISLVIWVCILVPAAGASRERDDGKVSFKERRRGSPRVATFNKAKAQALDLRIYQMQQAMKLGHQSRWDQVNLSKRGHGSHRHDERQMHIYVKSGVRIAAARRHRFPHALHRRAHPARRQLPLRAATGRMASQQQQQQNPSWVFSLLTGKFFVPCLYHEDAKKNEKNVFCLDCCDPICSHCSHHRHRAHRLLQVRRYVYQDVVRLEDFEKLFDCSFIQSYTTNNAKVVFLNQRPQTRPLKCSGSSCSSCERTLQQPYHFCSLGCKVEHLVRYEDCAPVCSRPRCGGFPRPPGSPGPRSGDAGDGHAALGASLLEGAACDRAPPGSSGVAGVARCGEPRCTGATEGLVVARKKRTRAVADAVAAAAAAAGDAGTGLFCRSRNAPVHSSHHHPLASFKRKGVPIRSPLY